MTQLGNVDWRQAVGEGLYTAAFVGKLTNTSTSKIAMWLRPTTGGRLPAAILSRQVDVAGQFGIPFLALIEARLIAHFRGKGVSLQTIRKVARKLRDDYRNEHPFADRRFRTDGKRVLMEHADDDHERSLIDILTDEFAFPTVIEPSLLDAIVYVGDLAARLTPFPELPEIVIDPRIAIGHAATRRGRIPTKTLAAAFLAEGDPSAVAEWFGTDVDSVIQAVAFEQRLAA